MFLVFISLIFYLILILGRQYSLKNKKKHMMISSIAIILDTSLVLYLAIMRDVLEKIQIEMSILLVIHIFLAITVVVAYFLAAYYGIKLSRGDETARFKMKKLDKIIMPTRFLVFVTILILKLNS